MVKTSAVENQKLLDFFEIITNSNSNVETDLLCYEIIKQLHRIYGYKQINFWVAKQINHAEPTSLNIDNFEPVSIHVNKKLLKEYLDGYGVLDILHPYNVGYNLLSKNKVLYITDLMNFEQFEKNAYYKFLKMFNVYHELTMNFFDGETLLGGIGIIHSINEPFNNTERANLEKVSTYIGKTLATHLKFKEKELSEELFKAFSLQSSTGLIVFDHLYHIHFANFTAKEICKQFINENRSDNCLEFFIKYILPNKIPLWQMGATKKIISPYFTELTMQIVPSNYLLKSNKHNLFMLYLIPENTFAESSFTQLKQSCEKYNLTMREREVIGLLLKGFSNQEIAGELVVSLHTVKKHFQNLFSKCDVKNRTSLCAKFNQ